MSEQNKELRVHIDPGHYGSKYNRSTTNKAYYESVMNFKLANYLKEELEEQGAVVSLSRTNINSNPSLYNRGYGAKGCDIFLSIHSNACSTESVDYPVVYRGFDKTESNKLAQQLADAIHELMNTKQKGRVSTRKNSAGTGEYYGVLNGVRKAGLVYYYILEHSFHTNSKATEWLLNDDNLHKLAKKEAQIIFDYFNYGLSTPSKPNQSSSTNVSNKTTFKVKIKADSLNIRKGPSTSYPIVRAITDKGVYTITEVKNEHWGKLKSGLGYISILPAYVDRV